MDIQQSLQQLKKDLADKEVVLVAVTKTKPPRLIMQAYEEGCRDLGENRVQELIEKHEKLPKDIRWHMIGHLQRNKVKYIAPFIYLIHSVDSLSLLKTINKEGAKNRRPLPCLLQVRITQEKTKFVLSEKELFEVLNADELRTMKYVKIRGLMGIAPNTNDKAQVKEAFVKLKILFEQIKQHYQLPHVVMEELSMGMSSDYKIAVEVGSTMIRLGSTIFGSRT